MWAYINNNTVTTIQPELPKVWENISNFHMLSADEVRPYAWLPLSQNIPAHDADTEIAVSQGYSISETAVVEDFAIAPKPVTPPIVRNTLSLLEFTRRFTMTEDATLEGVALNTDTPLSLRAQLNTLNKRLDRATNIDVTDPDTIMGVHFAVGLLNQLNVIATADMSKRIADLLAPATASATP